MERFDSFLFLSSVIDSYPEENSIRINIQLCNINETRKQESMFDRSTLQVMLTKTVYYCIF